MAALTEALRSQIANAARETPGVLVAFLFGSQLTNRTWAESDLDVAVRWDSKLDSTGRHRGTLSLIAALTDALGPLGERADIVDLDRVDSAVAFRAVRDGVCAYDVSKSERVRVIVDVIRRYDDDAPRRELFRRAALRAAQGSREAARGRP